MNRFGFTAATRAKFPWIFEKGEIDRHECKRVVPMEVLSLGMGMYHTFQTDYIDVKKFKQAEQEQHQCNAL